MLGTVGLEVTNFINTELSWKTVTKGARSGSRRSRKPARSLNMGAQPDDRSMKTEDSSVSESEKLGVAVLGRHFGDKVGHLPMKKRRLLLRSPSPPPRTSSPLCEEDQSSQPKTTPQPEDSDQTIDSKCASGQGCFSDAASNRESGECHGSVAVQFSHIEKGLVNQKLSEANGKLDYTEDFSGIALLVAAACTNSTSDDAHNVKEGPVVEEFSTPEGIDSSSSASSVDKTTTSSEMGNLLREELEDKNNLNSSLGQDKQDCEGKRRPSVKDKRSHWDLNTVMEAWELPCDDVNIGSEIKCPDSVPVDGMHCEKANLLTALGERQPVVAVDVGKQDIAAPAADATPMDSSFRVEPKELMSKSYECFDNTAVDNLPDYGYGSNLSQGGHGHMVKDGKMTEIQAGYDSPFEDGELRESLAYSWEENELEGDAEYVDYDSDNRDADDFDTDNRCMSEAGSVSCQMLGNESLGDKVLQHGANILMESSRLVGLEKFSRQDQLLEVCEYSPFGIEEGNDVGSPKILASDSMVGINIKGSTAVEVGSSPTRGELLLAHEGPSNSDALHEKDTIYMQRNRTRSDTCFRGERVFTYDRSMGRDRLAPRMQDANRGDGHLVDSPAGGYWGSRNHNPNSYHDPQGNGYPRPRRFNVNSAAKEDELLYNDDERRPLSFSSKGTYRPFIRRRSPADNDDGYSPHRRMVGGRNNSHFTNRGGRSGMYHRQYHGPKFDERASSPLHRQHYSAMRERSFSPVFSRGGGASFTRPYRKSQSRSRSRSPPTWQLLQRKRNMGVRRFSRSPDFRPEDRIERRIRMPIPFRKQPKFKADDNEAVFMSPPLPSRRFSPPPRCSRFTNDDRDCGAARFRDRKSPGRFFERRQRFDSAGSPPHRMKSDNYFRPPTIRRGRFNFNGGGAGSREHNKSSNGSDSDRTKHGDRYEMNHYRMRRCDTSTRQFRYGVDGDCSETRNHHENDSCIKGSERRVGPRGGRGARDGFRFDNGPKSSGNRGYNEDASPRLPVSSHDEDDSCIKGSDRRDGPWGGRGARDGFRFINGPKLSGNRGYNEDASLRLPVSSHDEDDSCIKGSEGRDGPTDGFIFNDGPKLSGNQGYDEDASPIK